LHPHRGASLHRIEAHLPALAALGCAVRWDFAWLVSATPCASTSLYLLTLLPSLQPRGRALSGGLPAAAVADYSNPMPALLFMQRLAEGLIHEAPFRARKVFYSKAQAN
jgi:hypothetical protein